MVVFQYEVWFVDYVVGVAVVAFISMILKAISTYYAFKRKSVHSLWVLFCNGFSDMFVCAGVYGLR